MRRHNLSVKVLIDTVAISFSSKPTREHQSEDSYHFLSFGWRFLPYARFDQLLHAFTFWLMMSVRLFFIVTLSYLVLYHLHIFTFWLPMSSRLFLIRWTSLLNWFFSSRACIRSFRWTCNTIFFEDSALYLSSSTCIPPFRWTCCHTILRFQSKLK